jgi:flagellar biosynthetic protein FliP
MRLIPIVAVTAMLVGTATAIAATPSTPYQESFVVHRAEQRPTPIRNAVHPLSSPRSEQPASLTAPSAASSPTTPTPAALMNALGKAGDTSTPWAIVLGLTLLTLLPAILLAMTPMVRLLVVFHFLRQALGTQTAPSNQVLMGLALMMTWFLMQPVLTQVDQQALTPFRNGQLSASEAIDRGSIPVKHYMLHYAREKDLALFVHAAHLGAPKSPDDVPMSAVAPAYILSELKAGLQIGAVLFLPFLLIDFLVASVTTSIGMLQLSPVVISTPIKILLFVMVDGWSLLADQLIKSF